MADDALVVAYRALWPQQFEQVAAALRQAMSEAMSEATNKAADGDATAVFAIEHIGSTAVPGLCAKPVLDVLLGVAQLAQAEALAPALADIGYRYRPEHEAQILQRRYFVRDADTAWPRVHLHAVIHDGPLWRQHLHFRDRLRHDAGTRQAYAELKQRLAAEHAHDKVAYTNAKAPFIRAVLVGDVPLDR